MKGALIIEDKLVMSWDEFMAKAAEVDDAARAAARGARAGRAGQPDLHVGDHWAAKGGDALPRQPDLDGGAGDPAIGIGPTDRILSYLPLSHIAEQQFTIAVPALSGAQVFYAESIDKLADNLKEVRPTIFFAVPRVGEVPRRDQRAAGRGPRGQEGDRR